jgi:hypothetical protein
MKATRNITFLILIGVLSFGARAGAFSTWNGFTQYWGVVCDSSLSFSGGEIWAEASCACATGACEDTLDGEFCSDFFDTCNSVCDTDYCGILEYDCTGGTGHCVCKAKGWSGVCE